MSTHDTVSRIRIALTATANSDLAASSRQLLAALGYRSDRVPAVQPASVQDFTVPITRPRTRGPTRSSGLWTTHSR